MQQPDTIILQFAKGDDYSKVSLENAVIDIRRGVSDDDRRRLNDALLAALDIEKDKFPDENHTDLLHHDRISKLVNALLLLNEAYVIDTLVKVRQRLRKRESAEELENVALIGRIGKNNDTGGVMGAILAYDYKQSGTEAFTSYLGVTIQRTFFSTSKELATYKAVDSHLERIGEKTDRFLDAHSEDSRNHVLDRESIDAVLDCIKYLPIERRPVAQFYFDYLLEHGCRPLLTEVSAKFGYKGRERARQQVQDSVERLFAIVEEKLPQLAEGHTNNWKTFKDAFENSHKIEHGQLG